MEQLSWLLFLKSFEEAERWSGDASRDRGHDRGGAGEGVSRGAVERGKSWTGGGHGIPD
jgi:hypothetical protein